MTPAGVETEAVVLESVPSQYLCVEKKKNPVAGSREIDIIYSKKNLFLHTSIHYKVEFAMIASSLNHCFHW